MPNTNICPKLDQYQQLLSGSLSDGDKESLLTHLEGCDACAQQLKTLPEPDTLVGLLRQSDTVSEEMSRKAIAELVERLSKLRPQSGAAATNVPKASGPIDVTIDQPDQAAPQATYEFLAPPQAPDEIGRLGPYRVLEVLGSGGMGVVFRAEDPQLARLVALKAMLPGFIASDNARRRFLREAQSAAAFKHDNIVSIYQVGEDRGILFLAMEFLEGEPLDKRLDREGKLPVAEVLRIGKQVATALAAAHKRGMIHRDIKPANIWLEAETNRVKILDFGLARTSGENAQLTQQGAIVGTPAYMAPEQGKGKPVDHRCDLFSLGCVLYRLATGKPAFHGTDVVSTLVAVATQTPRAPKVLEPRLPRALSDLIVQLLAKDAAKRPESAQVVAERLEAIAQEQVRVVPKKPRRWWPIVAGAAACLALLVAGIVFYMQTPDGTVRIEIDDPDIKLTIEGNEATFTDKDKEPISVKPGKHGLTIKRGDFVFDTTSFQLAKRGKTALKITWHPGQKMVVTQDGVVIGEKTAPVAAAWPFDAQQARARQEAAAHQHGVKVEIENSIGMRFRLIPAGRFMMGTPQAEIDENVAKAKAAGQPDHVIHFLELEGPHREVTIKQPYFLGVHEVTQKAWKSVMGNNPSSNQKSDDLPVESISWVEAVNFCNRLSEREGHSPCYHIDGDTVDFVEGDGYRLPRVDEWEYACRAGSATKYFFGDDPAPLGMYDWFSGNSSGRTHPVGGKLANPFGLHDMYGNVHELAQFTNNKGSNYKFQPARGGTFDWQAAKIGSANQISGKRTDKGLWLGVRVLLSVTGAKKAVATTIPPRIMPLTSKPSAYTNALGMEFALVPKGNAWLGGGAGKPGDKEVDFKHDFYLGVYEVTQEQWQQLMGNNPSLLTRTGGGKDAIKTVSDDDLKKFPVEFVSWYDAQRFVAELNKRDQQSGWTYRLPTETEWEYACRGGPMTDKAESAFDFYLATPTNLLSPKENSYGGSRGLGLQRASKVGSFAPNKLGLHDMHGNVVEWCDDEISPDPKNPNGPPRRVIRGGHFWGDTDDCRASYRFVHDATFRNPSMGMRVARVRVADQTRYTNSLGMEFARVPRGKAWLGGGGGTVGDREVEFREDFYLGVYEVTQEQWQTVTGSNPSHFSRMGARKDAVKTIPDAELRRFPVENVSWHDAQLFLKLLNAQVKDAGWEYRLPTEAEWEYACRGGPMSDKSESAFDYYLDKPSNQLLPKQANFKDVLDRPAPVGSYQPNRLGLFDMHGNVWEWSNDPRGIFRGGGWNAAAWASAASHNGKQQPGHRNNPLGLRVARVRSGKEPIPPHSAREPADYDSLAKGKWIPLLTSAEEFNRLIAAKANFGDASKFKFVDGILECKADLYAGLRFPSISGKDVIIRARMKKLPGHNISLQLRQRSDQEWYGAWFNGGQHFGIGRGRKGWKDLKDILVPERYDDFFEFAFAAVGKRLILYVNGKKILEAEDDLPSEDKIQGGVTAVASSFGTGLFKDIQVQILDGARAAEPDRRAAEFILSLPREHAIAVQVNDVDRWINKASDLPAEPFRLTAVWAEWVTRLDDDGLANFAGCKHLKVLRLWGTQTSAQGLVHFKDCQELQELSLNGDNFDDAGVALFKDRKHLTTFHVITKNVTDAGVTNFQWTKDLTTLTLSHTQVTDAGLSNFKDNKSLKILNLGAAKVTNACLAPFADCKDLEALELFWTDIDDAGLAHFKDCKKLTRVNLDRLSKVTDKGIAIFKDASDLSVLNLGSTQVTNDGLALVKSWPKLRLLLLPNTKIADAGLVHLKTCVQLEELSLAGTRVNGSGVVHLKDCARLVRLTLHGTEMDDANIPALGQLTKLRWLAVERTRLTAEGAKKLSAALPQCEIVSDHGVFRPGNKMK